MSTEVYDLYHKQKLKNEQDEIRKSISDEKKQKHKERREQVIICVIGIIVSAIMTNLFYKSEEISEQINRIIASFIGMSTICSIAYAYYASKINTKIKIDKIRLAEIDDELELIEIATEEYTKRTEVQFKNHQKELRRYYDINLGQLKLVFPIGIATMFIGIVIIGLTLFFFGNNAKENIAPVLAGTISGILIDFVGAVFIRMYMETIKASTEFHNKLIHSNDNLFANVLATKITDENLKNETFSEMAKIIARGQPEMKESKDNN